MSKTEKTWKAQIYCGLRKGYSNDIHSIEKVYRACQKYVDEIGWCVTVTPTKFIYRQGHKPGVIIEAIQYPRFPTPEEVLRVRVTELAKILLKELEQYRLTICFPEQTIMMENEDVS